jgi:transposase-like protein
MPTYGDRDTSAGRIALEIPKLRKGSCFPSFIKPWRTAKKALVAVTEEARVRGILTGSAQCEATCLKVRECGRIMSRAMIVAVAFNAPRSAPV